MAEESEDLNKRRARIWDMVLGSAYKKYEAPDLSRCKWLKAGSHVTDAQAYSEYAQRLQLGEQATIEAQRAQIQAHLKAKAAKVCPDCGSALRQSVTHDGYACSDCGGFFPDKEVRKMEGDAYCPNCGLKMNPDLDRYGYVCSDPKCHGFIRAADRPTKPPVTFATYVFCPSCSHRFPIVGKGLLTSAQTAERFISVCPNCTRDIHPDELIYDTPKPLPTGAKENPLMAENNTATATPGVVYRGIEAPTLLSEFADAAARGLKIGASRAAVKKLVSIARQALGESYPKFFDTTIGRQIESAAVCGVVLLVCNQWTSMPKRELIKSVALLGVESSSSETAQLVGSVVAPWIESVAAELVGAAPELLLAAPRQIEGE